MLKQDSWETLISFICSSNNHISRIGSMVRKLCEALGEPLPHPSSFSHSTVHDADSLRSFIPSSLATSSLHRSSIPSSAVPTSLPHLYAFPLPSRLTPDTTDDLLRELGFGYRSRYVNESAILLVEKAAEAGVSTSEWLDGLSEGRMEVSKARAALLEFIGVGRKVADCVLLFGLGFKGIVPIDTHVFQVRPHSSEDCTALTLCEIDCDSRLRIPRYENDGAHSRAAQQSRWPTRGTLGSLRRMVSTSSLFRRSRFDQEIVSIAFADERKARIEFRDAGEEAEGGEG